MEPVAQAGDVHVRYRLTDALDDAAVSTAIAVLSDEERARRARFHAQRDRDGYAMAHALLRTTLSTFGDRPPGDWRFTEGVHGKPALADAAARLSFNLSHARGLVACAVTIDADVGIDVEAVTRATDWRAVASRHFSAAELSEIDREDPASQAIRFFEIWTLKEAFIKALGVGLSRPLTAMTFSVQGAGTIGFLPPPGVEADAWQFALHAPAAGHRLALAISDGTRRRRRIHIRDDLHSAA